MDDTLICPICQKKLSNYAVSSRQDLDKTSTYTERKCAGMNHIIVLLSNKKTNKIDYIKMSLNPNYSKFIEIDFFNKKSRISCFRDGKPEHIEISKMLEPDFPQLTKLKEKVNLFVLFL